MTTGLPYNPNMDLSELSYNAMTILPMLAKIAKVQNFIKNI
jgi:hypothetical protein